MFVARFKRADSVVLLEVNQQPRTTLEGDIFDSPWRFIAAAPSSLSRPRTSCANLSRDATPLRSLAEPCPEPPCAALCLPLFPSLSPESSFHANMATATSTAFHAVARSPASSLQTRVAQAGMERGEGGGEEDTADGAATEDGEPSHHRPASRHTASANTSFGATALYAITKWRSQDKKWCPLNEPE